MAHDIWYDEENPKENECGFLFQRGVLKGILQPCKHTIYTSPGYTTEASRASGVVQVCKLHPKLLMRDPNFASCVAAIDAPDGHITLHSVDGKLREAGIKDIILTCEIRFIMNTVLVAEKTAQANVISRLEEVASTRSLLNTAKPLDKNEVLRRLKELEYLESVFNRTKYYLFGMFRRFFARHLLPGSTLLTRASAQLGPPYKKSLEICSKI